MNQSPFRVFGFRLFDKVMFYGEKRFIYARRLSGSFKIKDIDGENEKNISYKKLKYIGHGLTSIEVDQSYGYKANTHNNE